MSPARPPNAPPTKFPATGMIDPAVAPRAPKIVAPMAANAALPTGSLNTKKFSAKSISPPMIGILFTIGLMKFLRNLSPALVPPFPRTPTNPCLASLVTADLPALPPNFVTASFPNF